METYAQTLKKATLMICEAIVQYPLKYSRKFFATGFANIYNFLNKEFLRSLQNIPVESITKIKVLRSY